MKPKSLEPKAQQSRRAMQEPDGRLTLTSPRVMNHSPSTLNYGDIAQQTYPTLAFIANKSQFIIGHWTLSLPLVSREWKNGSNSSYTCTPFLHSLLTKGRLDGTWLRSPAGPRSHASLQGAMRSARQPSVPGKSRPEGSGFRTGPPKSKISVAPNPTK